jgi:hypothetical protein
VKRRRRMTFLEAVKALDTEGDGEVERPYMGLWRHAVRDSALNSVAKLVGYTIGEYANAKGEAYPALTTIARGASLGRRGNAVKAGIECLAEAGLLTVERRRGRRGWSYCCVLPEEETRALSAGLVGEETRVSDQETRVSDQETRVSAPNTRALSAGEVELEVELEVEEKSGAADELGEEKRARAEAARLAQIADQAAKEIAHRPGLKAWLLDEGARLAADPAAFSPALARRFRRPVGPEMTEMCRKYALARTPQVREEDAMNGDRQGGAEGQA